MTALDVRSTLICAGDSLHSCVVISFSSCGQLWRVSVFFHAFVVLDYWVFQPLAYKECMPSACCVVASVIVVVTMYVCMPSVAMLLGTIGRASFVFTSTSFGGGGVCYGLISAQTTNLTVIQKMSVSARRFALPYLLK